MHGTHGGMNEVNGEMDGLRIGVLRLGRVAGKIKYALIDERDITVVQQYTIEPRVDVDQNGTGGYIYAAAYAIGGDRYAARYLQEILWERHRGGVAPGWHVVHKNGITVDNRLENLELVNHWEKRARHFSMCEEDKVHLKSRENSLYWCMISQLLGNPHEVNFYYGPTKWFDPNGHSDHTRHEMFPLYYECHFPPCTRMERTIREFNICGRCQQVRYCGPLCQERDWYLHKRFCRIPPGTRDASPDR